MRYNMVVGQKVKVRDVLPESAAKYRSHVIHKLTGQVVTIIFGPYLEPTMKFVIVKVLRENDSVDFWSKPEWLETIEPSEPECYEAVFRRKRDENLRAVFGAP